MIVALMLARNLAYFLSKRSPQRLAFFRPISSRCSIRLVRHHTFPIYLRQMVNMKVRLSRPWRYCITIERYRTRNKTKH